MTRDDPRSSCCGMPPSGVKGAALLTCTAGTGCCSLPACKQPWALDLSCTGAAGGRAASRAVTPRTRLQPAQPNAAAAAGGRPGPTSWRRAAVQQHHHAPLRSDSGCSGCLTNPWPTLARRASWHEGDSRGSSQPALDPAQARLGRHGQAARQPAAPAPVPSQLAPGAFPPNAQRPAL